MCPLKLKLVRVRTGWRRINFLIFFSFLLDQKGNKKSRQNDASAHKAFTLARRFVGPRLFDSVLFARYSWGDIIFFVLLNDASR